MILKSRVADSRIELGDIEAALNAHLDVVESAVIPIPDEVSTNRLLAYVATGPNQTEADLVEFCAEKIQRHDPRALRDPCCITHDLDGENRPQISIRASSSVDG